MQLTRRLSRADRGTMVFLVVVGAFVVCQGALILLGTMTKAETDPNKAKNMVATFRNEVMIPSGCKE